MPLGAARFGLLGGVADLGKLQLIEKKSISASSSSIFTDIQEDVYDVHFLTVTEYKPSVDNTALNMRFYESGVEATSGYAYSHYLINVVPATATLKSTSASGLFLINYCGNTGNEFGNVNSYLYNLGNSNKSSFHTQNSTSYEHTASAFRTMQGGGLLNNSSVVDQIKLYVSSGTFSAVATLFGIKQT